MSQIVLDDIWKVFGDGTEAVRSFDLEIGDGEFMVLVGPSGCGKTTVLRMVAGLEAISKGEVRIGDRVVNDVPPKDRDIAMVFQNYALYPHMSVYDNMAFGLKLQRCRAPRSTSGCERPPASSTSTTSWPAQAHGPVGGQRQRVAMGRAIVRHPQAFLMDEPLSNLDAKLRVQIRAEIARLQHDLGVTTIYVTHDQVRGHDHGRPGGRHAQGRAPAGRHPQTLYEHPVNLFVAGFIGSPAMNLVEASLALSDGGMVGRAGRLPAAGPRRGAGRAPGLAAYRDRKIVLGIRPEDMEDASLVSDAPPSGASPSTVELREALGSDVARPLPGRRPAGRHRGRRRAGHRRRPSPTTRRCEAGHTERHRPPQPPHAGPHGERIELVVDTHRLHFFDPDDGSGSTARRRRRRPDRPATALHTTQQSTTAKETHDAIRRLMAVPAVCRDAAAACGDDDDDDGGGAPDRGRWRRRGHRLRQRAERDGARGGRGHPGRRRRADQLGGRLRRRDRGVGQLRGGVPDPRRGRHPRRRLLPQPGRWPTPSTRARVSLEDMGFDIAELDAQLRRVPSWRSVEVDGEHYGMPTNVNLKSMIWYPKDDFDAAGYAVPETFDDLIALSDQIVDDGGTPWCVGFESEDATGLAGHRLDGRHHAPHRGRRRLRPVGDPRDPVQRPGRGDRGRDVRRRSCSARATCSVAPTRRRPSPSATPRRPCSRIRRAAGCTARPASSTPSSPRGRGGRRRLRLVPASRPSTRKAPCSPASSRSTFRDASRGRRLPRAVHRRGRAVRHGRRSRPRPGSRPTSTSGRTATPTTSWPTPRWS